MFSLFLYICLYAKCWLLAGAAISVLTQSNFRQTIAGYGGVMRFVCLVVMFH